MMKMGTLMLFLMLFSLVNNQHASLNSGNDLESKSEVDLLSNHATNYESKSSGKIYSAEKRGGGGGHGGGGHGGGGGTRGGGRISGSSSLTTMMNTRSTDVGLLTNRNLMEAQMTNMMNLINQLSESMRALENRVINGEGTSQRREPGGQIGQNECHNGSSYGRLTKVYLFIGGLKEEIAYAVRMFKPTSLFDVFCLSKLQEASNSVTKGRSTSALTACKNNVVGTTYNREGGSVTRNVANMHVQTNTTMPNRPFEKFTQQELEEKRAKHLCFYYDQKYSPGHKCSGKMHSLEILAFNEEVDNDNCEIDTQEMVREEEPMLQVSLNAMIRVISYQAMITKVHVKKQVLHLLVDCGRTHNFLDLHAAKRMGCNLSKICPLQVLVANEQVMSSVYECNNFKWSIQG
nr:hypothetical protein [Tanacetum cinerariifolium]